MYNNPKMHTHDRTLINIINPNTFLSLRNTNSKVIILLGISLNSYGHEFIKRPC